MSRKVKTHSRLQELQFNMITSHRVRKSTGVWLLASAFLWLAEPAITSANLVHVTRWDGSTIDGQWAGSKDGLALEFKNADGLAAIPLDDVAQVDFQSPITAPSGSVGFYLHSGGALSGHLTAGLPDTIRVKTIIGDCAIGWNHLAGIRLAEPTQFRRANELFEEALKNRSPSQDALVSRDKADVKVLQGRLESLDEKGGAFNFSGEMRKFQNDKMFGIIFAAGAGGASASSAIVSFVDGSSLSAAIVSADETVLRLRTSFGTDAETPLTNLRRIQLRSDRVQYLSELKPASQKLDGVLHAPWPVGSDRNVLGSPISMGGRTFERGIGVHSRTELTYAIKGEFSQFAATIGIDDAVRPLGNVIMQVQGDGKTLFDSGPLRGTDPPRNILLDVRGVHTLTLLVDYGVGLDASDHANWADARLLRPLKPKSSTR